MASELINEIEYATYKLDSNLKIIQIDENFTKVTGYTREDITEQAIYQADLILEEDREEYFAMVQANLEKTGEAYIEHRIKCKDGSVKFVFCLGHAATDTDGAPISIIRTMDVTNLIFMRIQAEKIRKENDDALEQWIRIANTDELTGVLRRGAFLPTINEIINEENEYALLILDVDDFKNINDFCGHSVGDIVLKELAHTFQNAVQEQDLVCRIGGDEFAIFLQWVGDANAAQTVAGQIIAEVNKLQHLTKERVPIHVSIGGVVHNKSSKFDLKKMFIEADDALYEAKDNGKNQYVIR